ncbi:hypothetical protein AB1N83_010924 [Pleurotus pulmonarius]
MDAKRPGVRWIHGHSTPMTVYYSVGIATPDCQFTSLLPPGGSLDSGLGITSDKTMNGTAADSGVTSPRRKLRPRTNATLVWTMRDPLADHAE